MGDGGNQEAFSILSSDDQGSMLSVMVPTSALLPGNEIRIKGTRSTTVDQHTLQKDSLTMSASYLERINIFSGPSLFGGNYKQQVFTLLESSIDLKNGLDKHLRGAQLPI
jgi:hypothetical protein